MNHKPKSGPNSELPTCEKYLNKMLRQEANAVSRRAQAPRQFQDKFSHITRQIHPPAPQRPKQKPNALRQQSPIQRIAAQMLLTAQRENMSGNNAKEVPKNVNPNNRSRSRTRSGSDTKEAWGRILSNNKSNDKISSFSNFDPLRTLHFLSKELSNILQHLVPDQRDVLQMIADIQNALKRIPPELTVLHNNQVNCSLLAQENPKHKTATKLCQTPPTLYQEDTERFQKIMEENTYRLEASCKQLELVCANLQNEKEMTEKELEETRDQLDFVCKKVKELEEELEEASCEKIKQLEEKNQHLQEQLNIAIQEVNDNPTLKHLRSLVETLKREKNESDENSSRLEYDMTLLKMEKEKFVTMLAVRDKEIREIQEEMCKIQDQVNKQLKKLNSETIERVNSLQTISDQWGAMSENAFLDIGDTISTITTNESEKAYMVKETPCGDAKVTKEVDKFQADRVDSNLAATYKEDAAFENLLTGLTPSIQALLSSKNA